MQRRSYKGRVLFFGKGRKGIYSDVSYKVQAITYNSDVRFLLFAFGTRCTTGIIATLYCSAKTTTFLRRQVFFSSELSCFCGYTLTRYEITNTSGL